MIMQRGLVVEMGTARAVLDAPEHPYSQLLKSSVLSVDALGDSGEASAGTPGPLVVPSGQLVEGADGRLVRRAGAGRVQ
jgi:peptide/nickel transport system ATP-binding protein